MGRMQPGTRSSFPPPGAGIVAVTAPLPRERPAEAHRRQKLIALAVSVLVHASLLLLVFLVVVARLPNEAPAIIAVNDGPLADRPVDRKTFQQRVPVRPSASSAPMREIVSARQVAPVAIPVSVDTTLDDTIGFGTSFGDGLGFGSGTGAGGAVSFLGQSATAERVVFVVDCSQSMSPRHVQLMKDELEKSLTKLPRTVDYQVLFFAGPVWSADEKVVAGRRRGQGKTIIETRKGSGKHEWQQSGSAVGYRYLGEGTYPKYPWNQATRASIRQTIEHTREIELVFGTDWVVALGTALAMDPKPDVIFFVTDGVMGGNVETIVEEVVRAARRGSDTTINTVGLLEPQKAEGLREIAKRTKGEFKVVK